MHPNINLFNELFEHIADLYTTIAGKRIVIFGAGKAGQILSFVLNGFYIQDYYFVDNDSNRLNTKLHGKNVSRPTDLLAEDKDRIVVLIGSMYYDEIAAQLMEYGFLPRKHFHRVLFDQYSANISSDAKAAKPFRISHIQRTINLLNVRAYGEMCIIDVGAYKGAPEDSTPEFARAFPHIPVYAFEPLQETFYVLKKNVRQYNNVEPICCALSDKIGEGSINVTSVSHSSSLLEINDEAVNQLKNKYSEVLAFAKTEPIHMNTLDAFVEERGISAIGILKIDTQGGELAVLSGASNSLQKTALIVLEMNNHETYVNAPKYYEVDAFLREKGFVLYDLIPSIYEKGKLYEFDAIYANKNRMNYINQTEQYDELLR